MEKSVAILTIATNGYKDYWQEMAKSLLENLDCNVVLHVASESLDIADKIILSDSKKQSIKIHQIPAFGWPEATLLRFEIYEKIVEEITQDYICYIDADMLVHKNFVKSLNSKLEENDVLLVRHPGFYRPRRKRLAKLYVRHPKILISDMKKMVVVGSLGSWETNRKSQAYVERRLRKIYVCGGFWIGKNFQIKKLITELSLEVRRDSLNNVMAKWHDESHLNKWAISNSHLLIDPMYCFDDTYPNLKGINKVISAIRK